MYCGCRNCPWWGMICVACWQLSTEKLVGMLTKTLASGGRQQDAWARSRGAGPGPIRGAAEGGAEELDDVAVLDWREDEPLEVPELAIMGMVSSRRPLLAPPPASAAAPPEESSCLGRRQRQQHTATAEPTRMKATKTEPTIKKGTYMGTAKDKGRKGL